MDYEKEYKGALARCKWLLSIGMISEIAATDMFRELMDNDSENIRKEIINIFHSLADGKIPVDINYADIFTWLENIPYTIDHEKREGFHLGYKAGLEKQSETSDQIHYWTEEEIEPIISDYLRGAEHYGGMIGRLRCLKPKSLEKQGEKSLTVDIESMIEAYEQRLINQGNGVRNSLIVNMCVAAFKHGVENTLDELHLKQGEISPILSNSSNIGKNAWSEEDEEHYKACLQYFDAVNPDMVYYKDYQWLKSIKQRIGG